MADEQPDQPKPPDQASHEPNLVAEKGSEDVSPEGTGEDVEASAELCKATRAVQRAKEELHRAQQIYEEVRQEATERLKQSRDSTVGEMVECGLELVRKHPGPGVIAAAMVGFFLGRLFRR
jgi:ElaB/YqjD/DUF883 family membrane-anchored ribosome-binding protein